MKKSACTRALIEEWEEEQREKKEAAKRRKSQSARAFLASSAFVDVRSLFRTQVGNRHRPRPVRRQSRASPSGVAPPPVTLPLALRPPNLAARGQRPTNIRTRMKTAMQRASQRGAGSGARRNTMVASSPSLSPMPASGNLSRHYPARIKAPSQPQMRNQTKMGQRAGLRPLRRDPLVPSRFKLPAEKPLPLHLPLLIHPARLHSSSKIPAHPHPQHIRRPPRLGFMSR